MSDFKRLISASRRLISACKLSGVSGIAGLVPEILTRSLPFTLQVGSFPSAMYLRIVRSDRFRMPTASLTVGHWAGVLSGILPLFVWCAIIRIEI